MAGHRKYFEDKLKKKFPIKYKYHVNIMLNIPTNLVACIFIVSNTFQHLIALQFLIATLSSERCHSKKAKCI